MEEQDFDLREGLKHLLRLSVTDEGQKQRAAALGLDPEKLCNGMLVAVSLFESAVGGNTTALRELCSLLEEGGSGGEVIILDDVSP